VAMADKMPMIVMIMMSSTVVKAFFISTSTFGVCV
jgi:hypothetical protein